MVIDVLVADQLKFLIVFNKTCWPTERRLSPFVVTYIAPRPSYKGLQIGSLFSLFCPGRGMGPCNFTFESLHCILVVSYIQNIALLGWTDTTSSNSQLRHF